MMTNYSFKKIHSKWHKFLHADFKHSYKFSYRKKAESEGATYSIRYILKDLSSPCFYMFWQPCMVQKRMKKRQWQVPTSQYLPRKYPIEKSIVLKRKLYLGDATNQILIEFGQQHPMLLTETCYNIKNQVFGGATNRDMSLIETCFHSRLYGKIISAISQNDKN